MKKFFRIPNLYNSQRVYINLARKTIFDMLTHQTSYKQEKIYIACNHLRLKKIMVAIANIKNVKMIMGMASVVKYSSMN